MNQFSLTRADRIKSRYEFVELSKTGKKLNNKYFLALFSINPKGRTRLGITVTKKVGNAVIRNRIKRIIREYFRLNKHNIIGFWDINIIAKKEASAISSDRVFNSLQWIFSNIARRP